MHLKTITPDPATRSPGITYGVVRAHGSRRAGRAHWTVEVNRRTVFMRPETVRCGPRSAAFQTRVFEAVHRLPPSVPDAEWREVLARGLRRGIAIDIGQRAVFAVPLAPFGAHALPSAERAEMRRLLAIVGAEEESDLLMLDWPHSAASEPENQAATSGPGISGDERPPAR